MHFVDLVVVFFFFVCVDFFFFWGGGGEGKLVRVDGTAFIYKQFIIRYLGNHADSTVFFLNVCFLAFDHGFAILIISMTKYFKKLRRKNR